MIARTQNGLLSTDLDCAFFELLNLNKLDPVPPGVVTDDDPRLTDQRMPKPGSVTDISCAINAGIQQAKLNLNGLIPTAWLGNTSTTAARGDLAEYRVNKAVANGYASLDGTGKVPVSQMPTGVGLGTVTSVGLTMPAQFSVAGSPVTTNGVLAINWVSVATGSWFGNNTGSTAAPAFSTSPIPLTLVPNLDASKVTSGIFSPLRIPLAVGVGAGHAPGAAPDPGATGSGLDYLARDMTYRVVPQFGPGYQPVAPQPILSISVGPPPYIVSFNAVMEGESLFYSIGNPNGGFAPIADGGTVTLVAGHTVYSYGAKQGYTNSNIVSVSAPTVPPTELVTTGTDPEQLVTGDDSLNVTVGP